MNAEKQIFPPDKQIREVYNNLGKLYICGTPIGNLEDVSIRLLKTLRKVDFIACEDTRHTVKLLNKYKIKKKLISYHEHSKRGREDYIIDQLMEGKHIALVSDAGMPGICDPGENLVKRAVERDIDIEVVPGPSACIAALSISGLDTSTFIFEGFIPKQSKKRIELFYKIINEKRTVVYYETPHRLLKTLNDIKTALGDKRKIVIMREITKRYQETIRGTVTEVIEIFQDTVPRGEFCILIEGDKDQQVEVDVEQLIREVDELVAAGVDKKEAFKLKAKEYAIQKAVIYKYYVNRNL